MENYRRHVLGNHDKTTFQQCCVLCGEVIVNGDPTGWSEGPLLISEKKNPTIFISEENHMDDETIEIIDCLK